MLLLEVASPNETAFLSFSGSLRHEFGFAGAIRVITFIADTDDPIFTDTKRLFTGEFSTACVTLQKFSPFSLKCFTEDTL